MVILMLCVFYHNEKMKKIGMEIWIWDSTLSWWDARATGEDGITQEGVENEESAGSGTEPQVFLGSAAGGGRQGELGRKPCCLSWDSSLQMTEMRLELVWASWGMHGFIETQEGQGWLPWAPNSTWSWVWSVSRTSVSLSCPVLVGFCIRLLHEVTSSSELTSSQAFPPFASLSIN